MRTLNRTAVVITAKQPFLDWLHRIDETNQDLGTEDTCCEPTIYLLPETRDPEESAAILAGVCDEIFEQELNSWYEEPEIWPADRSFGTFREWFDYRFHSMLVDLCEDEPLLDDE